MRKLFTSLMALGLVVLICTTVISPMVSAQATSSPGSAVASPDVPVFPEFSIRPVGDHPQGFFNDVNVESGSAAELAVEIRNTGTLPVDLITYKVNALSGVNGGYVSGELDAEPIGPTTWIDYPMQEFQLEPGERHEVRFAVTVPAGVVPGQYISGLVVRTADSLEIPGTDVFRQYLASVISIGILVPGEITPSFTLGEPETMGDATSRQVSVPITNTGNYLVRPVGELTLHKTDGERVLTSGIEMGSLYAGLSTTIQVPLPEQMPLGDYTLSLTLKDEKTGASASLDDVSVTVAAPVEPERATPVPGPVFEVQGASIIPNSDPVQYADVEATIVNNGAHIPTANVVLNVQQDGKDVESYPLAQNQALPRGETDFRQRYIPVGGWTSGEYTFQLVVSSESGSTETILGTIDVEDTISVP